MRRAQCRGRLYLNQQLVGNIDIRGWHGAWGFGDFHPEPAFASFAPIYHEWSRLMHSPEAADHLTPDVADALRKVECAMYAISAKIYVEELKEWRRVGILTIDGSLTEWKEMGSDEGEAPDESRGEREGRSASARKGIRS